MSYVAHVRSDAGFSIDGLGNKLKSFGKTLFLKLVESRMETAKYRIAGLKP